MTTFPLNAPDLLHIAQNMREWDRKEIFATRFGDSTEELVKELMLFPEFGWIAGIDGEAIAAIGAIPCWPGMWAVWMFATPELSRIGKKLTRFVREAMAPALVSIGCHRAECRSMDGHLDAQRWLEHLGATREGKLLSYGRHGETFFTYVWHPQKPTSSRSLSRSLRMAQT